MPRKLNLTPKAERQYQEVRNRFNITRREWQQYYNDLRRANAKGRRLEKQGNTAYTPKFSTKTTRLKTRADFLKNRRAVNRVLQRDYRVQVNEKVRSNFIKNAQNYFGNNRDAQNLILRLKALNDKQLTELYNSNRELGTILYDSDPVKIAVAMRILDLSIDEILLRINKIGA